MAGEVGTAEVLPASGAPEGAPSGEGTPTPAAQPPGEASADGTGAPEGTTTAAAEKVPDPHVPWSKFREVQTGYSRLRREYDAATKKATEQIATFEKDLAEHRQYKDDYTALADALRAHPDIADALQERLRGASGRPVPSGGAAASVAALPPELLKRLEKVDELHASVQEARKAQVQAEQRMADQKVDTELQGTLKSCLAERKYSEKLLPQARRYVLSRIHEMGDDADDLTMEDVKYIFAEWFKEMETFHQERVGATVNGLREDAKLPAVPGATPPVSGKPDMGALDGRTARTLEQMLKERGWDG